MLSKRIDLLNSSHSLCVDVLTYIYVVLESLAIIIAVACFAISAVMLKYINYIMVSFFLLVILLTF